MHKAAGRAQSRYPSGRLRTTVMSATLATNGQSLRDTFKAWHAEREVIDSQLSESLAALSAYQSHLDEWQHRLAQDREELQSTKSEIDVQRQEIAEERAAILHELEELQSTKTLLDQSFGQFETAREMIDRDREELQSARDQMELDRELIQVKREELESFRAETVAAQAELEAARTELEAARQLFETERSGAQSSLDELTRERDELMAAKAQLESDWNELRGARGKIEQERDELRVERNQLERDREAVEKGQIEASATLTAELNAARDKIGALTTNLLDRTQELRNLDTHRSEAVAELEVARAREKDLKTLVEEQKLAAEQERSHWKEELRQLRDLLQRRVETQTLEPCTKSATTPTAVPAASVPAASTTTPTGHVQPSSGANARVIPRENPVLGSIVQQFDKLRQQRASDRHSANKSR